MGQGPVRPPRGWARESELGRAPCDLCGAGPQTLSGAGLRDTAEGLGPRRRVWQGPVRPPRGCAPETQWGRAACDRRGVGPQMPPGEGPRAAAQWLAPEAEWGRARGTA